MPISLVGTATGTTTATPPAHQTGDLFLVFAFRDGSTSAPSLATGFTSVATSSGNTTSFRVGRKFATSAADTVGTWSSATSLILIVLRGVNTTTPTGGTGTSTGSSTTITYNSVTLADSSGTSWVMAFAGHRSADVAIETVPSGMTLTASVADATDEAVAHRLEGATSFTSRTAAVGGTSSGWISSSVEIRAQPENVALTPSGIDAGAPVISATALAQVHAVSPVALSAGAPAFSAAALAQDHAAAPATISAGVPDLGAAAISQAHGLSPSGIAAGAPVLGSPALAQDSALAPTGFASWAPVLGGPEAAQGHALSPADLSAGQPVAGAPELTIVAAVQVPIRLAARRPATPRLLAVSPGVPRLAARRRRTILAAASPAPMRIAARRSMTRLLARAPGGTEG